MIITAIIRDTYDHSHPVFLGHRSLRMITETSSSNYPGAVFFEVASEPSGPWRVLEDDSGPVVLPILPLYRALPEGLTLGCQYIRVCYGIPEDRVNNHGTDVFFELTVL
jgi:hypothetical protein